MIWVVAHPHVRLSLGPSQQPQNRPANRQPPCNPSTFEKSHIIGATSYPPPPATTSCRPSSTHKAAHLQGYLAHKKQRPPRTLQ